MERARIGVVAASALLCSASSADEGDAPGALAVMLKEAQSQWSAPTPGAILPYGPDGYVVVDGARGIGIEGNAHATAFPGVCEQTTLTFKLLPQAAVSPNGPAALRVRDVEVLKLYALRRIAPRAQRTSEDFRRDEAACLNPPDDQRGMTARADDAEAVWLAGQAISQIGADLRLPRPRLRYSCPGHDCPARDRWKGLVVRERYYGAERPDCPDQVCVTVTLESDEYRGPLWRLTARGRLPARGQAPVFSSWDARSQHLLFFD